MLQKNKAFAEPKQVRSQRHLPRGNDVETNSKGREEISVRIRKTGHFKQMEQHVQKAEIRVT